MQLVNWLFCHNGGYRRVKRALCALCASFARFTACGTARVDVVSIEVGYCWHLREVMATRGLWKTTELVPILRERGISLSDAQIRRLVTQPPERLNLHALAAMCDALECSVSDIIEVYAITTVEDDPA